MDGFCCLWYGVVESIDDTCNFNLRQVFVNFNLTNNFPIHDNDLSQVNLTQTY